jgi:hypothetical protein
VQRFRDARGQARISRLEDLPNVGPAIALKLRQLAIRTPLDLAGRDPYDLYAKLNARTGVRHDPCLLDVFISATRFVAGAPARPWWAYTAGRKKQLTPRRRRGT